MSEVPLQGSGFRGQALGFGVFLTITCLTIRDPSSVSWVFFSDTTKTRKLPPHGTLD